MSVIVPPPARLSWDVPPDCRAEPAESVEPQERGF